MRESKTNISDKRRQRIESGALKEIKIARTIKKNERPLEIFSRRLARDLGSGAKIFTVNSMNLVILDGIVPQIDEQHVTPKKRRNFNSDLQKYLDKHLGAREHVVRVNREEPLIAVGIGKNILALNIDLDEVLMDEWLLTEEFTKRYTGTVDRKRLDPLIELGILAKTEAEILREDPMSLLPSDAIVPRTVPLNGLQSYLGLVNLQDQFIEFS